MLRRDSFTPSTTGAASVKSVQIAATPIVPAPIRRTFCDHIAEAKAPMLCPSAGVPSDVK